VFRIDLRLQIEEVRPVRWLIASSVAIVMIGSAGVQAADLPRPGPALYAPPTAVRAVADWTGFYLGGNVGAAMARDHSDFSAGGVPFASADTSLWGAAGGVQGGFNWQSGPLVLGAEGDFQWSNLKGTISAQCTPCAPAANASLEHDVDWFGTARARLGYAADGWLAYVTGGYAFGRVALKGTATGAGATTTLTQNATPSGWTLGAGTEVAFAPHWSAKLEYLYVDLGAVTNTIVVGGAVPSLTDHGRVQMNVMRAGVNYRF
jgi:outer membrane immunogenic protein